MMSVDCVADTVEISLSSVDQSDPQDAHGTICIQRQAYNRSNFQKKFGVHSKKSPLQLRYRLQNEVTRYFTSQSLIRKLTSFFPVFTWLQSYSWKKCIVGDILAGLTVGVVIIPQGMAYAALASLPLVYGIYTSFFPALIYVFMGTGHHNMWGAFGVTAIMTGDAVERIFSENAVESLTSDAMVTEKVMIAVTLSFVVGLILFVMGALNVGFVTAYLSSTLISAFTTGAAIHVATSQVPHVLGINITRRQGILSIPYTWIDIFQHILSTNLATLIISVVCLVLLIIGSWISMKFQQKMRIVLPTDIIVVVIGTIVSFFGSLESKFGINIVNDIPSGFPQPMAPHVAYMGAVFQDAFAIAVTTYAIDISVGNTFAVRNNYKIDSNQELFACGSANLIGSFFRCIPTGASLSRSWIQEKTGGSSLAVLGTIIIFALRNMMKNYSILPSLYRHSKWDFLVWVVTNSSTVLLGVSVGLFVSVIFAVSTLALRAHLTFFAVEGKVESTELFGDVNKYKVSSHKDVLVFHMQSSLCYINAEKFKRCLRKTVASFTSPETKQVVTNDQTVSSNGFEGGLPNGLHGENSAPSKVKGHMSVVIINCQTFSFVDLDGAKALSSVINKYSEKNMRVVLASCPESVCCFLQECGEFDKYKGKDVFFPSIQDAFFFICDSSC